MQTKDGKLMLTSRLHIVGLPYHEVGGCLGEFFAEAQGRAMTLRPEPTNEWDANAICAYDWQGRHVGYVSGNDVMEAWRTLRGSGRRSLRGRVTMVNAEHKCLTFECQVESLGEVEDLFPQAPYLDWAYSGPVLRQTQEMVTLEYMMDEISERLEERDDWNDAEHDDFVALATRFCRLSKYDLSGDMSDYRRRLCLQLLTTKDDELLAIAEELKMAFGRTGRETHGGEVLDYWMRVLSEPKMVKSLLVHRQEYDVDKVRQQLEAFPEMMYQEWLENKEHFVSKLLYMHIPRKVLWQLVSGIAFYEAVMTRHGMEEEREYQEPEESPIYLSTARGQKIDLIRVLNVMYEQGRFNGKDGAKLMKKEFFATMGRVLNVDLSDYDKHLSRAFSDGTKLEKNICVFDDMKEKMIAIWNSK